MLFPPRNGNIGDTAGSLTREISDAGIWNNEKNIIYSYPFGTTANTSTYQTEMYDILEKMI